MGLNKGWQHEEGAKLSKDLYLETDVVIIGSGAGGGTTAEILTQAGLKVILVEEGPLQTSSHFHMLEKEAYPNLYQDSAARQTKDKNIRILQGRCVGGSTVVNWTTSFRTPNNTLKFWQQQLGLADYSPEQLQPWFARMEQRLNIKTWQAAANANNEILRQGAKNLGWHQQVIARNVKNCINLGYCGLGCPTNAKQSMLVTTIASAMEQGAKLLSQCRATRFVIKGGKIEKLQCTPLIKHQAQAFSVEIRAKHYVLSAGAIGSPALLLRSNVPDPYQQVGRGTFLHPTLISLAVMQEKVSGYSGAPQVIYCDQFNWPPAGKNTGESEIGFKIEAAPLYPLLSATTLRAHGLQHKQLMQQLPYAQGTIAMLRDGFHAQSQGGQVSLAEDGSPVLDYPITDYIKQGMKRAYLAIAELQFAGGAKKVLCIHEQGTFAYSWPEARRLINSWSMNGNKARLFSAHVMGGCAMAKEQQQGVVDSLGRHFQLNNLSIFDASIFPSSIGANPQLSIYGIVARMADFLSVQLSH